MPVVELSVAEFAASQRKVDALNACGAAWQDWASDAAGVSG